MFKNVLSDASTGKTRLLVTHALHFLPQVDYIYCVADGRIGEQGTYAELMASRGPFSALIEEFVTEEEKEEKEDSEIDDVVDEVAEAATKKRKMAMRGAQLMQQEERNKGAVSWDVYKTYLNAGHGFVMLPLLMVSLLLMQVATVLSSYW